MIKLFTKVGVFFLFLLGNMSLAMWIAAYNSFDNGGTPRIRHAAIISNAYAKAAESLPYVRTEPARQSGKQARQNTKQVAEPAVKKTEAPQLTLHFGVKTPGLPLDGKESLMRTLREYEVGYGVKAIISVAPSTENDSASQTAKLRAQTIARLIYPYTQEIEIHLISDTLAPETAAVRFIPQAAQAATVQSRL